MLSVGVPLEVIWETTPACALKVYESYVERLNEESEKLEFLAWRVGMYSGWAWNSPKTYPKKCPIKKKNNDDTVDDADAFDALLMSVPRSN